MPSQPQLVHPPTSTTYRVAQHHVVSIEQAQLAVGAAHSQQRARRIDSHVADGAARATRSTPTSVGGSGGSSSSVVLGGLECRPHVDEFGLGLAPRELVPPPHAARNRRGNCA